MRRRAVWVSVSLIVSICASPLAARGQTPEPASAQPTLPKPMPDLTVPGSGSSLPAPKSSSHARAPARHDHPRRRAARAFIVDPLERPALANVELVEPLPHPPQPPHVTVPVPAYPLEDFVMSFTAPPPPVVCRPTRRDRFKPDFGRVDETPVLCTSDNP